MDNQPTIGKSVNRPHQYKCGVCSEEGHNSRNCPLRTHSMGVGKQRMITPTKNGADAMLAPTQQQQQQQQHNPHPHQHQQQHQRQHQPQQPQAPVLFHSADALLNGRGNRIHARNRSFGAETESPGSLRALSGPFAHAVENMRRRVLESAENVAKAGSPDEYNASVEELVSSMDCFEKVVKCAMRFSSVSEGNLDPSEQDKKRRKKELGENH